jgi:hypothetical protein
MFIPSDPKYMESGVHGPMPILWYGVDAPDGDGNPWVQAPNGSIYVQQDITNELSLFHQKVKNDGADNDWVPLGGVGVLAETVALADFTDGGGAAGTYNLKTQIPQGAWVQQVILQDVTGFAGDTSAVITVGDGSDVDRYNTGTPSVFTTANAIDLGVPSGTKIHTAAATVTLTVTSGSDWGAVTAGQLTIKIFYLK